MQINIKNGTVAVHNSPDHTPRCLDISTHLCGRTVESSATHWPARPKDDVDGERAAYISVQVKADEMDFEVPRDEEDEYRKRSTEQSTYYDIEDARALRDALTIALDCADVK